MSLQGISSSKWFRPVALAMSLAVTGSTCAVGIEAIAKDVSLSLKALVDQIQGPPQAPRFSHAPSQPYLGAHPGRNKRAHIWTPENRALYNQAIVNRRLRFGQEPNESLLASLDPFIFQSSGSGGGGPLPDEGGYGGGGANSGGGPGAGGGGFGSGGGPTAGPPGGISNTATMNKLTQIPIVSWPTRGDVGVNFALFHNSQADVGSEFGDKWSHSYNIWIEDTSTGLGSTRVVHFPDGTLLPFESIGGSGHWKAFYPRYGRLYRATSISNFKFFSHNQTTYNFNGSGDLTSIVDLAGNMVTISRDGSGNITAVTDSYGSRSLTFNYTSGKVSSVVDSNSKTWSMTYTSGAIDVLTFPTINSTSYTLDFGYDGDDDVTSIVDRRGKTWSFTYGTKGKIESESYPTTGGSPPNSVTYFDHQSTYTDIKLPGHTTGTPQKYRHNFSHGGLASVVDPASYSVAYEYDAVFNPTHIVDQRGKDWVFSYDSKGNVLTRENPYNKVWTYTYNSLNGLLTVTDPNSEVLTITRTGDNKIDTVTNQLAIEVADYGYDAYGQVNSIKDAYNRETTVTYEANGDVESITTPSSGTTEFTYNDYGQMLTRENDSSVVEATVDYDAWLRPYKLTHADSTYIQLTYDPESNVTAVRDENAHVTDLTYDNAGELIEVENARGDIESYHYNANQWLWKVTNGRNYDRTYEFSIRGDVTKLTMPDGAIEQWTYNGTGDVTNYTSPLGGGSAYDIDYVYDDAGRMTKIDYDTGTDTDFTYDDLGRRTQMVDSSGTTAWTFNEASQMTYLDTPQGDVAYSFFDDGKVETLTNVGTGDTDYAYDSATGQLETITNPFSEVTTLEYDSLGRLDKKTFHSGQYEAYDYDSRNRLTDIDLKNSSDSVLLAQDYDYDAASNVIEHVKGATTTSYEYDEIDQLVEESRSGYLANYTYDNNGNRLTRTINSVQEDYTYDSGDKLTQISIGEYGVKDFTYDAAGRQISVFTAGSGLIAYYAYDYEARLTSITKSGTTTNSFAYNGLDTRISKVDSTGSNTFKRAGASVTAPVLADSGATYTPGVSERRSSTTKYFHPGLKNAEAQSSTSQVIGATKNYDAFGNLDTSSGSWTSPFGYGGPFSYQQDADHGLKLLGHRFYDSSTGRFLTRDPVKHGSNWYSYSSNNPSSRYDCDGLRTIGFSAGFGATCWPFGQWSQGWSIEIDIDNGHLGFSQTQGTADGQHSFGYAFGPGFGLQWDPTKTIKPGVTSDTSVAPGMSLGATIENDGSNVGSIGWGPGWGFSVYNETRVTETIDLGHWEEIFLGPGVRDPDDKPTRVIDDVLWNIA